MAGRKGKKRCMKEKDEGGVTKKGAERRREGKEERESEWVSRWVSEGGGRDRMKVENSRLEG